MNTQQKQFLRILRLFYQGLKLIVDGLRREIGAIEKEMIEDQTIHHDDSLELNPRPIARQ